MSKNCFVYVVCGSKEHIDTLHFSLNYLKKKSNTKIIVLTDSSRNEIPVVHDEVFDVKTPEEFNHHQASIYLKTGIFQFVPTGFNYCYIDTDVLPLNANVDLIFKEFIAPIRFAPDHCTLPYFSPYAINCSCQEILRIARITFEKALNEVDLHKNSSNPDIIFARKQLQDHYHHLKKNKIKAVLTAFRYFLARKQFMLSEDLIFDKKNRVWMNKNRLVFMNDFNIRKITIKSGLKWNVFKNEPSLKSGIGIWRDECKHLSEHIYSKFKIRVADKNFQHWNGGVFLFNDSSHEFLRTWFNFTLEIFKDETWKTRDQGTLIATVWKYGLEKHPTLDKKWNLIADFHNPLLEWTSSGNVIFSKDEIIAPNFVHVYHHFGDLDWFFWKDLMTQLDN